VVDSNAREHPASLEGTRPVELLIVRDRAVEPNPVTIEMTVNPTLTGATQVGVSFNERGGDFSASVTAPYEGFETTWVFQGSVIEGQGLAGELTIGGDGRLPGGQPIVYGVEGTRR
jgi:hypothetical protein